jgi:hypothetical protein
MVRRAAGTFDGKRLIRVRGLSEGGGDVDIRFGFACVGSGRRATVVQDFFTDDSPHGLGPWTRTRDTFRWRGARLAHIGRSGPTRLVGRPTAGQVGNHCGQPVPRPGNTLG